MVKDGISEQELIAIERYVNICIDVSSSEGDLFQKKTNNGRREHPVLALAFRQLLNLEMKT